MERALAICLFLIGLVAGCQSASSPETALQAVDGVVVPDERQPGRPIVEVRLVDPYAACPPFLLFHHVSDHHLVPLRDLKELKTLTIRSDKVTDAGLIHLKKLTNLERLDLHLEKITD